ncbi:MAG TPA: glycosyl transferase family 8 [Candidatus Woesearchaeota archaeon]|nr:glycosyl transferase family 8 [Candidatus Woesearchaeota archaeon]
MKHAIITFCDSKYGDFLVKHWLGSLKANVNLANIDVVVLDYGLSGDQVRQLRNNGVILIKCKRDGFPGATKFRDIERFLSENNYDQVLNCDAGDIIFQTDISNIFEQDKNTFRGVCEPVRTPFEKFFVPGFFDKETAQKIKKTLKGKKIVNGGFIMASSSLFKKLCKEGLEMIKENKFGPDQLVVSYIFHRDGFVDIGIDYNFVVLSSPEEFYVKKGELFFKNGKKIPVVHNAGRFGILRPILRFGFGKDRNRVNKARLTILRDLVRASSVIDK